MSLIEGRSTACLTTRASSTSLCGAEKAQSLLAGLTEYSYLLCEEKNFTPVDLEEVLKSVISDMQRAFNDRDARVSVSTCSAEALGDRELLRRAFKHVIDNACFTTMGHRNSTSVWSAKRHNFC